MTDISVIILTKNEKLHIRRCLERLAPLEARQIFIVDCFSTDGSDKVASEMGATVVQHEWPGLYAKQFNWALDNLPIKASWILRLDADEYLYPDAIIGKSDGEIRKSNLSDCSSSAVAVVVRVRWMNTS